MNVRSDLHSELEAVAKAKRYHLWLASVLSPYLVDPVLEIGAGIGTLAVQLASLGHAVIASELDPVMEPALRENTHAAQTMTVGIGVTLPATDPIVTHQAPATVLMSNVIEHIEEDVDALASLIRHLEPASRLVVVAPAHQWAHTGLDDRLGHYRRYTKSTLDRAITSAGWTVSTVRYFNPIGALTWAISGHLLRRTSITGWQTAIVEALVPLLRRVDRTLSGRWLGQSVIAVADRPA